MREIERDTPREKSQLGGEPLGGMSPIDLLGAALDIGTEADDSDGEPFEPPSPSSIKGMFPGFEIGELIGQGGMGAVYRATQLSLQRTVAIKILPVRNRSSAMFEERFHREAQALARLNHANIVTIHDFGQVKGLFYFVMEHVDGQSVAHLIRAGQMSPRHVLRLVPQICEALEYAHGEGIVHRDIKPGNILVDARGRVKVVDFGLAKLLDHKPRDLSLTRASQVMGTPQYMAPEQLENPLSVDHRADIYSLGVVFYEMLTGKVPSGHFPKPSDRAAIDPRFDDIVLCALASEPEQRFQAVSELRERLQEVEAKVQTLLLERAEAESPKPPAVSPPRPAIPPESSRPSVEFIVAASGLLLLGLLYYLGGWKALAGLALLACLLVGISCVVAWLRQRRLRQRKSAFRRDLWAIQPSAGASADPGELARLEDLRRNFDHGIETFRQYGKEPFDMPWYVLVGEPGAGKTEAIRHSSLRFPEGLQDRFQGVGGTYSMHWWFTNQAVILDTAGAMFMGEESVDRFGLFLRLLRRHRPGCPINGVLLAVPVDSLLLDEVDAARDKAASISRQLSVIQRELGVRFPIYLVLTKCDKIPGFREFFDAEQHGALAKQMVGWSQEANLDAPPDLGRIEEGLSGLARRWRRRRLALLDHATPEGQRRTESFDALYAYPACFQEAIAGLRSYLATLLAADEWRAMQPFFRGIYLTSSVREGAALDQELASALGLPPARLPEQGVWRRESAFFLRDFFLEKVFRESGLVTALRQTADRLRLQLTSFYAWSAAGLGLLAVMGILAATSIQKWHEKETYLWQAVNREWQNGAFAPIIERVPGKNEWRLSRRTIEVAGRPRPIEGFLQEMMSAAPGPFPWEPERSKQAKWIVLESCLAKPLLDAAREKQAKDKNPEIAKLLREMETGSATDWTALAQYVCPDQQTVFQLLSQHPDSRWWLRGAAPR